MIVCRLSLKSVREHILQYYLQPIDNRSTFQRLYSIKLININYNLCTQEKYNNINVNKVSCNFMLHQFILLHITYLLHLSYIIILWMNRFDQSKSPFYQTDVLVC